MSKIKNGIEAGIGAGLALGFAVVTASAVFTVRDKLEKFVAKRKRKAKTKKAKGVIKIKEIDDIIPEE